MVSKEWVVVSRVLAIEKNDGPLQSQPNISVRKVTTERYLSSLFEKSFYAWLPFFPLHYSVFSSSSCRILMTVNSTTQQMVNISLTLLAFRNFYTLYRKPYRMRISENKTAIGTLLKMQKLQLYIIKATNWNSPKVKEWTKLWFSRWCSFPTVVYTV